MVLLLKAEEEGRRERSRLNDSPDRNPYQTERVRVDHRGEYDEVQAPSDGRRRTELCDIY